MVLNQTEDIVAVAKTGTGKTAAFGIPLLQLINLENAHVQVVILAPTRELGQQIHTNLTAYAVHSPEISVAAVCGGIPIKTSNRTFKIANPYCGGNPRTFGGFSEAWRD